MLTNVNPRNIIRALLGLYYFPSEPVHALIFLARMLVLWSRAYSPRSVLCFSWPASLFGCGGRVDYP